ncbi:hypothetical protein [Vampirovibrio sp.]|uniref:hypothetical protein n=1 Tax=Vampirovibrio sp. TaxID=2717857 RepID=UPI0035942919
MLYFPSHSSYRADTPQKFSRTFPDIDRKFEQVALDIKETRHAIPQKHPQQLEGQLDKLELHMRELHPKVTEITEEVPLPPDFKTLLSDETHGLTDQLESLTQTLPSDRLRKKSAGLAEIQKMFQALMDFEFKNGSAKNPEKKDGSSFDRFFRNQANQHAQLVQANQFKITGLKKLNTKIKPEAGLAY